MINYELPLIHGQRQHRASSQQYASTATASSSSTSRSREPEIRATQLGKSCDIKCYLYRIGCGSRSGRNCISINLCDREEMMLQDQIKRFYNADIECLDENFEKLKDALEELR